MYQAINQLTYQFPPQPPCVYVWDHGVASSAAWRSATCPSIPWPPAIPSVSASVTRSDHPVTANSMPSYTSQDMSRTGHHQVSPKFNSLAPGTCASNFKSVILEHVFRIKFVSTFCEIGLRWMPQNTFDDKSTLVQVMAWCHQAASHYLSHCWPRSILSSGITRPQWVKTFIHNSNLMGI